MMRDVGFAGLAVAFSPSNAEFLRSWYSKKRYRRPIMTMREPP